MKKYLLLRIVKSIISIFVVTAIVVAMVYTMIPESRIFKGDMQYQKLKGNERFVYSNQVLKRLGYQDFYTLGEMCNIASENPSQCTEGSGDKDAVIKSFEEKGFTITTLDGAGSLKGAVLGTRRYGALELVWRYFSNLVKFDNPNAVKDPANTELDANRGYYFGKDHNGMPALMCTGCEYKYQVYLSATFPFIHSNAFRLNFGESYPTKAGISTIDHIFDGQGNLKAVDMVYPTGYEAKGSENLHTLRYNPNPDRLAKNRYNDNYTIAKNYTDAPSMVTMSYIFGLVSLILSYLIAIPAGIAMAKNRGKLADKLGIFYINLLIAIPSLAFIYIVKYLTTFAGFPDKFPQLGYYNIKSYVLPLIILTILSTPGLMTWIRRYMIDQSSSDYVKFARAKGLTKGEISRNHIFKNAIIPIVNGIPGSIVLAIGGSVMTEAIFAIPGMGKMLPDAIDSSNNNMVITLTFIFTALSVFSLLLGDILLTWVDPRIQLNAKKGDL